MAPGQNYGGYPAQGTYQQQPGYGQPAYPDQSGQYGGYPQQSYAAAPPAKPKKSGTLRKVGALLTMVGIVLVGTGITIVGSVVISENSYNNGCYYGGNTCTPTQEQHQVSNANNATSIVTLIIGLGVVLLGVGIGLLTLTRPFSRMEA